MKRHLHSLVVAHVIFIFIAASEPSYAANVSLGPDAGVAPLRIVPERSPTLSSIPTGGDEVKAPGRTADLSRQATPPGRPESFETQAPFTATTSMLTSWIGATFDGMQFFNAYPYDAGIAVGPTQVLLTTNCQFGVFDKSTGTRLLVTQFNPFFRAVGRGAVDPKCLYDAEADRFIIVAVERAAPEAWLFVATSSTGDATGAWNVYTFDATLTGTEPTNTFSDYPSLGTDNERIYVGTDQATFNDNFRFAKVRCFSKAELYAGIPARYVDLTGFKYQNGPDASTVKAGRNLTSSNVGHLLATRARGGRDVSMWTIQGAFPNLVLTGPMPVGVRRYRYPPDAEQAGSTTPVTPNDCRAQDLVWRNGRSYVTFTEGGGQGAQAADCAIRYLEVSDGGVATRDLTYWVPGVDLFYPTATVDPSGNAAIVFSRSSVGEYPSCWAARLPVDGTFDSPQLIRAGERAWELVRWGDYSGVANDPGDPGLVWMTGGWLDRLNAWRTAVASGKPSASAMMARSEASTRAGTGELGLHFAPNPFNPSSEVEFSLARPGNVSLRVFDARGRLVATLLDGTHSSGRHRVTLDARDLASGVYWAQLRSADGEQTARIAVIK